MQKKILLFVVYAAFTGICIQAQIKKQPVPAPPTAPEAPVEIMVAPPPPPPPPPIPPCPTAEILEEEVETTVVAEINPVTIVNSNGFEISVQNLQGKTMVVTEKNGVVQKIRLSTWNANRKYYEKKYGQLPPPPPPPPAPPVPVKF